MSILQTKILTDTWVLATWDECIEIVEQPEYKKAKCYYYNQQMRIEMSAVGPNHANDNTIIAIFVNLYGIARAIPMVGFVNCSYRQTGLREAQPDLSYYIGERVKLAPRGSSVVNLDNNQPPDLVIEIADTSFADDVGIKRMLYEEMGIAEYWVVNVQLALITAFRIIPNRGSQRITQSLVLPGLEFALLEEGLRRSREMDNTEVANWFLSQF